MTAPQPFTRAHVQIMGNVNLGIVSCRWLPGGLLEVEGGDTYGPGAVYRVRAVQQQEPVPEAWALLEALEARATDSEMDGPSRWKVWPERGDERNTFGRGPTLLSAYADAVGAMRARSGKREPPGGLTEVDRNLLLLAMDATDRDTGEDGPDRWWVASHWGGGHMGPTFVEAYAKMAEASMGRAEDAHEEACTDPRARRAEQLLQAMERIEKDGLPATIFCASGKGSGRWTLDICEEAPVGGTLDEMVNAILNRAPAEPPPPAADPAPKAALSDDDIPF